MVKRALITGITGPDGSYLAEVASRSRCKRLGGGGSFVVVMLGDGVDGFGLFGSGRWAQRCGWLEELAA